MAGCCVLYASCVRVVSCPVGSSAQWPGPTRVYQVFTPEVVCLVITVITKKYVFVTVDEPTTPPRSPPVCNEIGNGSHQRTRHDPQLESRPPALCGSRPQHEHAFAIA